MVQATPGWTHSQKTVTLAKPVHTDDGDVTQAVSEIHWTATTAGIRPGEFGEFVVIAEQLPDTAQLTFKAIQIYSDHSQVAWIEAPAPGSTAEPEHPAPVLKLADAASGDSAAPAVTAASGTPMAATKSSSQTGAVILAGTRRRRRCGGRVRCRRVQDQPPAHAVIRPPSVSVLAATAALLALLATGCSSSSPPGPPAASIGATLDQPVPPLIADLPLIDDTGHTTNLNAFPGKVVVLTDFLTLCQDVCPMTSANFAQLDADVPPRTWPARCSSSS